MHRPPSSIQWLHRNCLTWRSKMTRARGTRLSRTVGTSTARSATRGDSSLWTLPESRLVRSPSDRSLVKESTDNGSYKAQGTKARRRRVVKELQVAEN